MTPAQQAELDRINRCARQREQALKRQATARGESLDWKFGSLVKRNDMVEKLNNLSRGDIRKGRELSTSHG